MSYFKHPFGRPKHICGVEVAQCSHCESVFCPNCDCFTHSMKLCCKDAMNDFFKQGYRKLDYVSSKKKKKKEKIKVKIEEYGDGNL